jgi:DNA-binding response OmpR family regulator
MSYRILIVEDERKLAQTLQNGLAEAGFEAVIAFNGQEGKDLFYASEFDLVIIDINLPYINGYDLIKLIRARDSRVPVIILTALDQTEHKLKGFNLGADDYLVKPFEFQELLARINVLLRRLEMMNDEKLAREVTIANLTINFDSREVKRDDQQIRLTAKEFLLLSYLVRNQNKLVSRDEIGRHVWEIDFDPQTNVIDVYINYLRKKIDKGFSPKLIHTLIGMGYILKIKEE